MEKKIKFVGRAFDKLESFTELYREFGINTKTGYKWKKRFLAKGRLGLAELSRKPAGNPSRVGQETICEIIRTELVTGQR